MAESEITPAELGRLVGRLEKGMESSLDAVHRRLGQHDGRITSLEEARIRSEERWAAEERLKSELDRRDKAREEREEAQEEAQRGRLTLHVQRRVLVAYVVFGVLALLAAIIVPIWIASHSHAHAVVVHVAH